MKKKIRCPYFELNDLERAYHDKEWGTPCRNDRKLFEYLMYEVLQCGLSWDTIIQKRAAFRIAFERFDRSRRKIEAIIHDAQCFVALRRECGTFSKWLWAFTDGKTLHNPDNAKSDEWTAPARTELSDRIAAELKSRGFKFLGSVTIYAFMQSVGLVNDHARFCFRYKELRKGDGAKQMIPLALRGGIWFNMSHLQGIKCEWCGLCHRSKA